MEGIPVSDADALELVTRIDALVDTLAAVTGVLALHGAPKVGVTEALANIVEVVRNRYIDQVSYLLVKGSPYLEGVPVQEAHFFAQSVEADIAEL